MHMMVVEVLKKYEIYMHQLTQNARVKLGVFIWAVEAKVLGSMMNLLSSA